MRIRKATASDYPHIKKLSDELTRLEQAYENITYDEEDIEIPG
jgi:N-acetylglutamate synthase-like GNAT family acetyltransferase